MSRLTPDEATKIAEKLTEDECKNKGIQLLTIESKEDTGDYYTDEALAIYNFHYRHLTK
jgi:hypothetical protein